MKDEELLERRVSRLENVVGEIAESMGELESKLDAISANVAMLGMRVDATHRAWQDGQRMLLYVWVVASFAAVASGAILGVLWK